MKTKKKPPKEVSVMEVFKKTWQFQVAIGVLMFTAMIVISLFARVPTSGLTTTTMSQFLVYANLFGEFIGKQLNIVRKGRIIKDSNGILIAVLVRSIYVIPFLLYLTSNIGFVSDITLIATVAVYCTFTGYLCSLIYSNICPTVPHEMKSMSVALVSVFLMVGIIAGVLFALLLQNIVPALQNITIS